MSTFKCPDCSLLLNADGTDIHCCKPCREYVGHYDAAFVGCGRTHEAVEQLIAPVREAQLLVAACGASDPDLRPDTPTLA